MIPVEIGIIGLNRPHIGLSIVPAHVAAMVEFEQRVRARRIDHRKPGNPIDKSELMQLCKRLTKCA